MRLVGAILTSATLLAVGAAYAWNAKATILSEAREYASSDRSTWIHRFELLRYRYRPILAWRSIVNGNQPSQNEYTFGAWTIEKLLRTEWCGKGIGVTVEAVARYDYGETHAARFFYNFRTAQFLTTLDPRTSEAALNYALQRCITE